MYKPKGALPCMFSVELFKYVLLAAGMVHRGGSFNSYGCMQHAIPPLAVGRSYFMFVRGEWFFSDCSIVMM